MSRSNSVTISGKNKAISIREESFSKCSIKLEASFLETVRGLRTNACDYYKWFLESFKNFSLPEKGSE